MSGQNLLSKDIDTLLVESAAKLFCNLIPIY